MQHLPYLLHLLLRLVTLTLGQQCNCPLIGTLTTTTTPACPTNNILSTTLTSTIGACRNPRTTTTTTTRTAGGCACPTPTTVTSTATPSCAGVTATSTVIQRTIDCPWAGTVTRTVALYGGANDTANAATGIATVSSRVIAPGGAASTPSPAACSLTALPSSFYIRDMQSGNYILFDPFCGKAIGRPDRADATPFHVNRTDDGDISGVPQLSLYWPSRSSDSGEEDNGKVMGGGNGVESEREEYGAYVQYEGGPMRFFRAGDVPQQEGENAWYIVTAGFSEYLCRLSLITWNLHDLSTPEICGGYLSLGYGFGGDGECPEVRLAVEEA